MALPSVDVVKFKRLDETTVEDWKRIEELDQPFYAATADRVLAHLEELRQGQPSMEVGRYEHSLQTATLARRAGESEEYVVAALLHDIGDLLAPYDHGVLAAEVLKPFVSPSTYWLVRNHPVFQGYFFYDKIGQDRDKREMFRGHPDFEATALFCERYDQVAFDAAYDTLPVKAFEPQVRRLFAREPWALWRGAGPAMTHSLASV